jgi:hypothetical protein
VALALEPTTIHLAHSSMLTALTETATRARLYSRRKAENLLRSSKQSPNNAQQIGLA